MHVWLLHTLIYYTESINQGHLLVFYRTVYHIGVFYQHLKSIVSYTNPRE